MVPEGWSKGDVGAAALLLVPPSVRGPILERIGLSRSPVFSVDAVVRIEGSGAEFSRSRLFAVVRKVLASGGDVAQVEARDGTTWHVAQDAVKGVTIAGEGKAEAFPEFACFAPDARTRVDWFEKQRAAFCIEDGAGVRWREKLSERSLENQELDELLEEFRVTPQHWVATMRRRLRGPAFGPADLVPASLRYFERLAGVPPKGVRLPEFVKGALAVHARAVVAWDVFEGLKFLFALSAHEMVSEVIDLTSARREDVERVFRWLVEHGDQVSQVGAIECGLRHLALYPEIEGHLLGLVSAVASDEPQDASGRLSLLSGLVMLVEGEVARGGIARRRPIFWRRLASIAHAALLEREVVEAKLERGSLAEWARDRGGLWYTMQSLVDLRQEPRWFPDFVSPERLRAEFVGRILVAAERHRAGIEGRELGAVIWGEGSAFREDSLSVYIGVPGPLEGGLEAVVPIPPELESSIRSRLEGDELSAQSFFGLVNSAVIFRADTQLSDLAAQALARIGYQFRNSGGGDEAFALVNGLAMVGVVTRSTALAEGVRNLARIGRRHGRSSFPPYAVARVALMAAAANGGFSEWKKAVGDWVTELAFGKMSREEVVALEQVLGVLLEMEPGLWQACGRAVAAVGAVARSLPDEAGDARQSGKVARG